MYLDIFIEEESLFGNQSHFIFEISYDITSSGTPSSSPSNP